MALTEAEELELLELEEEEARAKQSKRTTESPQASGTHWGLAGSVPEAEYQQGKRNILGNIMDRPAGAVRSALSGTGGAEGFMNPTNVKAPSEVLKAFLERKLGATGGQIANAAVPQVGWLADMVTDPMQLAGLGSLGKPVVNTAVKGADAVGAGGRFISETLKKPGKLAKELEVLNGKISEQEMAIALKENEIINPQRQFGATQYQESYLPKVIDQEKAKAKILLDEQKKAFDSTTHKEAQRWASDMKSKARKFSEELGDSYEQSLNKVEGIVGNSNSNTDVGTFGKEIFENVLNKIDDPNAVAKITSIAKKQGYVVEEIPDVYTGFTKYSVYHPEQGQKIMTFKDMVSTKASIKDSLLSASARGKTGFTRNDIPYASVQEAWGSFLTNNFPKEVGQEFLALQSKAAPLLQSKWIINKIIKPYDTSEFALKKGTDFAKQIIRGVKNGKVDEGTVNLFNTLEKGNDLYKGMGDVTSGLKSVAQQGKIAEETINTHIAKLASKKQEVEKLLSQKKLLVEQSKFLKARSDTLLQEKISAERKLTKAKWITGAAVAGTVGAGPAVHTGRSLIGALIPQ